VETLARAVHVAHRNGIVRDLSRGCLSERGTMRGQYKRTLTAARKLLPSHLVRGMSFGAHLRSHRAQWIPFNSPEPGPWRRSFFLEVGIGLLRRPTPVEPGLESLEDHISHQGQPRIVGAGPVGLGAALFRGWPASSRCATNPPSSRKHWPSPAHTKARTQETRCAVVEWRMICAVVR
jgi:hypothetical protein